jgi:DnaJ-class molecular chaperone
MADGREIGVVCKHCKGEGRAQVRCAKCFGRGEVRKFVITPDIEGTTKCDRCGGVGVHLSRVRIPDNPAITPEIARKIIS